MNLEQRIAEAARNVSRRVGDGETPIPKAHSSFHPSQERFTDARFVADVLEFMVPGPCTMEPGKSCDKCDICATRGF
jgi:hypothetical protein